jgi:hypothetical protein
VRQERREQHVAVRDGLRGDVQDGRETRTLVVVGALGELPGRHVRDVPVHLGDRLHRLGQRRLLAMPLDELAGGVEGLLDEVQQRVVLRLQLACRRDLPEVGGDHAGGPVDQVAPAGDELVVGAADELRPGEVAVLVLRSRRGDEVAQRVGLVALEDVADEDHHAA